MTLKEYIKSKGMTHEAFGKLLGGVPQVTISRYVRGARFPSKETILLIQAATKGKVSVMDWYSNEEVSQ